MMIRQTARSQMVTYTSPMRPLSGARPTDRFRFDLERVVWDPAYRRWVVGELNRRAREDARDSGARRARREAA